jgi:predicted GH43/DUF377 family glycosyl hydrolase
MKSMLCNPKKNSIKRVIKAAGTILSVALLVLIFISTSNKVFAQTSWEKYAGNPVMFPGPPGAWDDHWLFSGDVLFDDTTYHMWYSSWDSVNTRIGYATSPDGIAWTKYADNPVLDNGLPGSWDESGGGRATVVYNESVYHMWYTGNNTSGVHRLGYATSPDKIVWTKYASNPVMDVGSPGTWDDSGILYEDVIFTDSLYQLWYTGWDSTNLRIGYATSPDGINWTKYAGNPVLNLGEAGSWDSAGVTSPTVVYHDSTYHMWYTGGEEMQPGIPYLLISFPGYATSSDGINWTKYAENPISNDPSVVSSGDAYYDGSTYHMWFSFCEWDGECHFRIHYSTAGITGIDEHSLNLPNQFELSQNYPNPFNPTTTINYQIPELSFVTLKVYGVLGNEIATLANEEKPIGSYEVEFNATALPSGIYFYRLQAGSFVETKKMVLIK